MSETQKNFVSHLSEDVQVQDSLYMMPQPDFHHLNKTSCTVLPTAGNHVQEKFKQTTDSPMQLSEDTQISKTLKSNNEDDSRLLSQTTKADPQRKNKRSVVEKGYPSSKKKLIGLQLHEVDGKKEDVFRSAIAPVAGTVKGLCMTRRPEPPPKPSSLKPISTRKSPTPESSAFVSEQAGKVSASSPRLHGSNVKVDYDVSERGNIPSDTAEQSNKKENLKKFISPTKQTSDDASVHLDKEDGTHSIHSQGLRSVSELLEEAKYLTMSDTPKIYERNFQLSKPEQSLTAAQQTFTAKAKSVDEIIASLWSARQTTSQSASDLKIKGLLDRVLGYSYSSKSEESPEVTTVHKEDNVINSQSECVVKTTQSEEEVLMQDFQQMAEKQIEEENMGSLPEIGHKVKLEEEATKDLDDTLLNAVSSPASKDVTTSIYEEEAFLKQNIFEITESLQDTLTNEEALKILALPTEVTYSDIVNAKGSAFGSLKKSAGDQQIRVEENENLLKQTSVLATWTPKNKDQGYQTIHHLCVAEPSHLLPIDLQHASRLYFTPSRLGHGSSKLPEFVQQVESDICSDDDFSSLEQQKIARYVYEGIPVSEVIQEDFQDSIKLLPPLSAEYLYEWQRIAEYYVERPRLILLGKSMKIHKDATKLFWTPAFPKFAVPISRIQEILYPKLQMESDQENPCDFHMNQDDDYDVEEEQEYLEDKAALLRTVLKKHKSLLDLRPFSFYSSDTFKNGDFKATIPAHQLETRNNEFLLTDLNETDDKPLMRIYKSSPNLCVYDAGKTLKISSPFHQTIKEIEYQREHLLESSLTRIQERTLSKTNSEDLITKVIQLQVSKSKSNISFENKQVPTINFENVVETNIEKKTTQKEVEAYMRKPVLPRKLAFVSNALSKPPSILTRSASLPSRICLNAINGKTSQPIKLKRKYSLPSLITFEAFVKTQGGIADRTPVREWVRNIWNKWFDEVLPPLKPPRKTVTDQNDRPLLYKGNDSQPVMANLGEIHLQNLLLPTESEKTVVYPLYSEVSTFQNTQAALLSEVNKLINLINVKGGSTAFNYCRRGALYRKLGQLQLAMEDLNKAIQLEPMLLDAYWHRHFIYLLQMKTSDALDDLNFVLKHNKSHADAYTSKGDIYRKKGDIIMAIINYSQGLKCRPDDDVYFRRAEMYEASNDLLLAMEDYRLAFTLNPKRTDAMMRHGQYYFKNSSWPTAIKDFTELIEAEPNNSQARNYRGQAYAKLGLFREAVLDMSVAIHLKPDNWVAFYHRACLLRKVHPHKALQDFSVSVLINNDIENLNSFLHRGILYTELSQWKAAIWDFNYVLKLDRAVCLAHINLGLIFLLQTNHYYEAICRFTDALKVEPTSTKAYVCRAEAHHKVHNLRNALKDITCAIHLQPQTQKLYLLRGQYLLEMKKFELANFSILYTAEINQDNTALDTSPVQQATVQTFLKNYDKAVDSLEGLEKSPSILTLLGKTKMKAGKHQEALINFQKALDIELERCEIQVMNPSMELAELHYLIGCCCSELDKLTKAVDSFDKALKIYPKFAKAYYQRGLCRMKLHEINCIYDFHRALAINPGLFEVYLSRAVYYAMQRRYLKGILSCNEALKLQPQSVRAFLCRGALKYCAKVYHLAINDLTTAININETCILGYFNRAVCYQQTNDFQKALKDYGIVRLLGSRKKLNLKVLINRGLLYLRMEDYYNASQDFKAAIVEDPKNPLIHHAVAICYHKIHYFEEAVNYFNQAVNLDPFFVDAYYGRGNVYMDSGHPAGIKQAQKDFVRALHLNPKCVKARLNLGYNLQVLGKFQKAWIHFAIAIDVDPKFQDAYEGRAVINLQMNNTFGALQDINAALKIYNSAKLLTNRGVISQFMGDLSNAMSDYKRAIALNPSYSLAYFNAANLYLYNSQFQQAHNHYTRAIDLQPGDESALLNRAICRVMLRHVKEALEDFEQAINLSPYSAHIYFNRANLYATLKQYQEAEKDYSQALQLKPGDALFYKLRADVRGHLGLIEHAITDYKIAIGIQEDK
ncbi:uncharacterized protein ttc6 [Hypanus sabinus]|uniref:uncharacterized protein ttc6 n=1 Tax=Hypanus sabinus TaxID=79690 RepID=UPI0028C4E9B3|nr:uncharacterized protein ttc6 [Hypanus sabinus]